MTVPPTKERSTAAKARSLAHRAVTEGVNLKYVEQMRQALYGLADENEWLRGLLEEALSEAEVRGLQLPATRAALERHP